jgi:hypothetical protein
MKTFFTAMVPLGAMAILFVLPPPAAAQSADELAKQTQNPIASLISVPLQGNWDFGLGTRDATASTLNFQPVIPFAINPSTNIVLRVIVPLTSQPAAGWDAGQDTPGTVTSQPAANGTTRYSGLGDILTTAFFSPSHAGALIWGVGPAMLLPTATNQALGAEKFAVGPSVVVLTQPGKWTLGLLANQLWSTSGAKDRPSVNQIYLQPFANYNLGKGLAAGVSMEASGNWKAQEQWNVPLLFSLSKVTLLGKRPVNLAVAAGPTLVNPSNGASWRFRLSATFLFPR